MNKENYYQKIDGSEIYYPWYVHKLEKENKILKQLLEWAGECGFGLDNFIDNDSDIDKFYEETKDMDYIESMIYFAERWNETNGRD